MIGHIKMHKKLLHLYTKQLDKIENLNTFKHTGKVPVLHADDPSWNLRHHIGSLLEIGLQKLNLKIE